MDSLAAYDDDDVEEDSADAQHTAPAAAAAAPSPTSPLSSPIQSERPAAAAQWAHKRKDIADSSFPQQQRDVKRSRLPPPAVSPPTLSRSPPSAPSHSVTAAHQGRVRSFPHVEGNWATHVFIPIPASASLLQLLAECGSELQPAGLPFTPLPASALHLSLSRTVVLRFHQIQPFTSALTSSLSSVLPLPAPLLLSLASLRFYTNDQRTRSFCSLAVQGGEASVLQLIRRVDGVMREFGLEVYYERPSLHVTCGWRTGDVFAQVRAQAAAAEDETAGQAAGDGQQGYAAVDSAEASAADVESGDEEGSSVDGRDCSLDRETLHACDVDVSAVHCRIGNRLIVIPLTGRQ